MRHEHKLEYESAIDDYNTKNVIKKNDNDELKSYDVRNKLLIAFSKTMFTVIFLTVCIWMLWISYYTLLDAIKIYIL